MAAPDLPVVTASGGAAWDSELLVALDRAPHGVRVARRCVDLPDLLAVAASGAARAALVSADLRRLDRDAVVRLAVAGVAVVGLAPPGDEPAERRLRQLGIAHVLPSDAGAEAVARAVSDAVADGPAGLRTALGDPLASYVPRAADDGAAPVAPAGSGSVVAVWGPTGAPGRTTVAVGIAAELAAAGTDVLLVDADVYGGVVAQVLGLLDESPGLAAASRAAGNGSLDVAVLAGLARQVTPTLRVLSGSARADRWPELRPGSVEAVLTTARALCAVTVVDVGFCLEQDEELVYDTAAPRRNGATLSVLEAADRVVAVGTSGPVGLQRLVRGLSDLREAVPGADPVVVVNRVRPGSEGDVRQALARHAGVADPHLLPEDAAVLDAAVAQGRTLVESAPRSAVRRALADLAGRLGGVAVPAPRRRSRLRAASR